MWNEKGMGCLIFSTRCIYYYIYTMHGISFWLNIFAHFTPDIHEKKREPNSRPSLALSLSTQYSLSCIRQMDSIKNVQCSNYVFRFTKDVNVKCIIKALLWRNTKHWTAVTLMIIMSLWWWHSRSNSCVGSGSFCCTNFQQTPPSTTYTNTHTHTRPLCDGVLKFGKIYVGTFPFVALTLGQFSYEIL